jgi:hypothetical protein
MKNLIKALQIESLERYNSFSKNLHEEKSTESILSKWFYTDLIPSTSKRREWKDKKELIDYLLDRYIKRGNKSLEETIKEVNTINEAREVESITINVEWKRSHMWGNNPSAEAIVKYKDGLHESFFSGSIGGCGYDKGSTAVAECINQIDGLLKPLYKIKDKNVNANNRELLGYGSGYGILPYIEGGVGTSCYPRIFEKAKYEFKHVSGGKSFDVYTITKIK